jgi:uncharacterized coiled-coil protein SlyX
MKIYQQELNDGLSEQMQATARIAFECPILQEEIKTNATDIEKSLAFMDKNQPDLFHLNSVLVSAGWNKNDDVFTSEYLWAAKDTPVNKQFNYMHDDNDIIGHITASMVVDKDGNIISDFPENESSLDIITSAVIYRAWSDPEVRERIENLISEIKEGKWAVSMECIFEDFDYAIRGPEGDRVLSRSETSAFLTKHLRVYGGTGEYHGYKVGRLLKGFYFSGKGLVDNPANPRSIIFKDVDPFEKNTNIQITNFLAAMEVSMPKDKPEAAEDFEAKAKQLEADFTAYKTVAETAKSESDTALASLEQRIKDLETAIADIQGVKEAQEREIAALNDKMKEKQKEMEDMKEECKTTQKKMKCMKRKASLTLAGIAEAKADELVSKFEDASDEMFESVVALLADNPAPQPEPKVEAETEEDEEVVASELDKVEEVSTASLANPSDEEAKVVTMKAAAKWLSSNLKTTKNLKSE